MIIQIKIHCNAIVYLCIHSCNAAFPKYQHVLITFFPFYLSNETNNEEKVLHIHPCQLYVDYNRDLDVYYYTDLSFLEAVACIKCICNLHFQIYISSDVITEYFRKYIVLEISNLFKWNQKIWYNYHEEIEVDHIISYQSFVLNRQNYFKYFYDTSCVHDSCLSYDVKIVNPPFDGSNRMECR